MWCHDHLILPFTHVYCTEDPVVARAHHPTRCAHHERGWAYAFRPVTGRQRPVEAQLDEHVSLCARWLTEIVEKLCGDRQHTVRAGHYTRAVERCCF